MTTNAANTNEMTVQTVAPTITALVENATKDPIDALRMTSDLYAVAAHSQECRAAASANVSPPPPPKLRSKYMRKFVRGVKAQLSAALAMLTPDEIARLKRLGAMFTDRIEERSVPQLPDDVLEALFKSPAELVAWGRAHIDRFEARLAS